MSRTNKEQKSRVAPGLTDAQLAERLAARGIQETERILNNKIN
ncbi:MAG: DUF6471 domain-containing protein [Proteobacteria bacterium]|nr:DUF6471 domain-containing protein [Pseudomonadota bacterium]